MNNNFVHLHCHTEYSLLDGAARVKNLIAEVKAQGMDSVAITDHGVMYGVIDFYQTAKAAGIKPIIGCEFYVAPKSRFDRNSKDDNNHHLVLLAQDDAGYKNLMRLATIAFTDGYYYKPRIDLEALSQNSKGLIGMSACLAGRVPNLILQGNNEGATKAALELREILGMENFYLELQDHGIKEQQTVNKALIDMAKKTGIELVASNDIHYVTQSDARTHELLLCIQTGKTLADENRMKFDSDQFYVKNAAEMAHIFGEIPSSLSNTLDIASRCNLEIELGRILLPKFEAPAGMSLEQHLQSQCLSQFEAMSLPEQYRDRLEHELSVINKMGFAAYFLIVADFVNYAKINKIAVGPGRGSAAGSLVSYLLGITEVDPIKYDLLFERFLNPERFEMPDIDIDFEHERRSEVINYVTEKYGADKVAQIITFSTMQARAAIRDAGRVLGYPYAKPDRIAKMITDPFMGIKDAIAKLPDFKEQYTSDEETRSIIDSAIGLEGIVRQDSVHAAGVVISKDRLTEYVPLQSKNTDTVTQYPMETVSKIGLLKMDFLGLKMLSVINKCLKFCQEKTGEPIDLRNLPLDDSKTYDLLKSANTIGVFQLSETGMRGLMADLKPSIFTDIIALVALYRPGPLGSGMHSEFVERKHGRKKIEYFHDSLEPILKETYGIIVYQEQVMQIAATLASFSMAEADTLRKAMGKKKPEVIQELKKKFIDGCKNNGVKDELAVRIFSLIEHFGEYGFNKSHSTAYALLAYQTAYLKANYPTEYMAAIISVESKAKDKAQRYLQESRRMGIKVLSPDINESLNDFAASGESLRFGLAGIRNVGDALVDMIINVRESQGPFKSMYDFCMRVGSKGSNKKALESLIKSGAMDCFGYPRNILLANCSRIVDMANKAIKESGMGQFSLFGTEQAEPEIEMVNTSELDDRQILTFEKEMLGMYISDHPLYKVEKVLQSKTDNHIADLSDLKDGQHVNIAGIINRVLLKTTKKGDKMAYIELEDLTGAVEVIVFPNLLEKAEELISEDSIVALQGRLDLKEKTGENEVKVIASSITSLESAQTVEHSYKRLELVLEGEKCDQDTLNRVVRAVKNNPGTVKLLLKVKQNGTMFTLAAGNGFKVATTNSLLQDLLRILPKEHIRLVK